MGDISPELLARLTSLDYRKLRQKFHDSEIENIELNVRLLSVSSEVGFALEILRNKSITPSQKCRLLHGLLYKVNKTLEQTQPKEFPVITGGLDDDDQMES
jgi:hypothetical protein